MNSKDQNKLLEHIKAECKKHGIKFTLRNGKYVQCDKNIKSSGFFDEGKQRLVCAKNHPDFFCILTHEYSHLTQALVKCKEWRKFDKEEFGIFDEWLNGKKIAFKKISNIAMIHLNLELDNEKRTVKVLKKFGLNQKETDIYIKKANAYILFYLYILKTGKWYKPHNAPYENKKLISIMSSKFNMNYKILSPKILNVFKEQNI